ncbi:MAG: SDR family NAD(P)-dependent oxidoreductase [Eubacterium sp.]|nr:SDR family NAD(P)-dependent oxidoreductase [Eubacterium sp.]
MHNTVLITGASSGVGKAAAIRFAAAGWQVLINCARSADVLLDLKQQLICLYHICCQAYIADVSSETALNDMFSRIKQDGFEIDLLINNAGISKIGPFQNMDLAEWLNMLNTNLTSAFLCSKAVLPDMLRRKSGKIINISSVWGNTGASCEAAYSAAKGGLNAFTKSLAKELAPSNIQVNAIACGVIDTPMNHVFTEEERHALISEIPAGRFATPKETADFIYRISECGSYFTGQVINFDGGWQ